MLYSDKIDVFQGIDVKKTSAQRLQCLSLIVFLKL